MPSKSVKIANRLGLHARAAAKFVQTAARYSSDIILEMDGKSVNGKSIMGVMMLAAYQGSEIEINAEGEDAVDALDALEALIADRFGEKS